MRPTALVTTALFALAQAVIAQVGKLIDPVNRHVPKDGKVTFYGAGGPHTASIKVADAWKAKTRKTVEIIFDPETTWSVKAQADADMLWGTSEQSMTAFLDTYKTFASVGVEPIYVRPTIIAVKKGNP